MRTSLAARIDPAIQAQVLPGRSRVCAKTPSRPEYDTNPDSRGDERYKAELPRSPTSFVPSLSRARTFVWAASTTVKPPLSREQTAHPSVRIQARYCGLLSGPRRGRDRFLRTGVCRFGGRPRGNGTLRRNGTRLVITMTSMVFQLEEKAPSPESAMASRAGRQLFTAW